jgi:hypothetical protein
MRIDATVLTVGDAAGVADGPPVVGGAAHEVATIASEAKVSNAMRGFPILMTALPVR